MKMNKFVAGLLSATLTLSILPANVMAANSKLTIDVDTVVKDTIDVGISTDYSIKEAIYSDGRTNPSFISAFSNFKMPLVRIGEGATKIFEWKDAIGDLEDRTEQTLWGVTDKVAVGPLEAVKAYEDINPDVAFTITLNMLTDTAEDAADLAEFLTGDASTEWGAKRVAYGHSEPVNVRLYELGNELDNNITVEEYIAKSKEFITAVKAADPDAKFAAHASTSIYNHVRDGNDDYDDWHLAVLADKELSDEIDYLALHTYYSYGSTGSLNGKGNGLMDKIVNLVEEDIKEAGAEGRIKIYISEHAGYYLADDDTNPNPHGMRGVTETANIYSRMMNQEAVEMMAYHGLDSSEWKHVVYNSTANTMHLNAIGHLSKMFSEYGRGEVLASSSPDFKEGVQSTVSSLAVKDAEGNINLIFSNKNSSSYNVDLSFSDNAEYKIARETRIVPAGSDGLNSDINATTNSIDVDTYDYATKPSASTYSVPAHSVCAIKLEKADAKKLNIASSYDFSDMSKVSSVVCDTEGIDPATLAIADGKLSVTTYDAEIGNYAGHYFYLTDENAESEFNLKADINIANVADEGSSILRVFLNSKITDGKCSEDNYIAIPLAEGAKKLEIKVAEDGTVSAYVNDAVVSANTAKLVNANGYIGFYANDVNFTLDNVVISEVEKKVELNSNFKYEENFDDIEDGRLPEGWEIMSSMVSAGVEDGKLVVNSRAWNTTEGLIFKNLGIVKREGLTMEADVKFIEHYGRDTTRPKTGFFYMADGADKSTGGLYTFHPQAEFTEVGSSSKPPTAGTTSLYGEGEGFLANETVKLRLVFASGTKSPDVYINGTKLTYYNTTNTTQNSGYLGLMMRACKAEFDNIKIMGTKTSEYPASELVTKLVDFTYEENFDDYVNGQLPAGWKLYEDYKGAAITPAKATASVQNGALEMKSPEWYNFAYVMLENLGEVQREGLTIEADFTRIGKPRGNENNASTGFAYMASIANGATTTDKTVIYTDKFTDNSTKQQGQSTATGVDKASFTNENLEGGQLYSGATVNMKVVCNELNQLPVVYLNGKEVPYSRNSGTLTQSGLLGLYARTSKVKIDNLKITGKRYVTVPNEFIYDAFFKTTTEEYFDKDAAIADVKVVELDALGYAKDVTKNAEISATVNGTDCKITVNYEGKTVKTLTCKLEKLVLKRFTYEENFDGYANGAMPEGWKLYKSKDAAAAKVVNGALEITSGDWYAADYILIEGLGEVERKGLTIEADIKRTTATSNGNSNNSRAGFAYDAAVGADGKVTAGYAALYTDKTVTNQQGISGEEGKSGTFTYVEGTTNTLQSGSTLNFKVALDDPKYHGTINVDGKEPSQSAQHIGTDMPGSGLVGLYSVNSKTTIDNIKITGWHYVPSTAVYTQDAAFKSNAAEYADKDAAIADVKVTETAPDGSVSDVTKYATITAEVEDYDCTITVTYEGKTVKVLTCKLAEPVWEGFVYEENFDSYANGTLPEGWVLYPAHANTKAKVVNGALEFTTGEWYKDEYILIESLGEVAREGLTIEADITRIAEADGNKNNSRGGFVYNAVVGKDGKVSSSGYSAIYTDKTLAYLQGRSSENGIKADFMYKEGTTSPMNSGETKHFKLTLNDTIQHGVVSIDGIQPDNAYNRYVGADKLGTSGLIGIYGYSTKIRIDNIRISGKRLKTPNTEDSMTAEPVKNVNGTPVVSAQLNVTDTDINTAMFVATVYNKQTGAFVTFDKRIFNMQDCKTAKVNFVLDEITDYSADKYLIKVMAMDQNTLQPVGEALEL